MLNLSMHDLAQTAIFAAIELDKSIRGKSQKLENFLKIQQWLLAIKEVLSTEKTEQGHPKWWVISWETVELLNNVLFLLDRPPPFETVTECFRQLQPRIRKVIRLFSQLAANPAEASGSQKDMAEKLKNFCHELSKESLRHITEHHPYRHLAA
jgi:hypothetical protein